MVLLGLLLLTTACNRTGNYSVRSGGLHSVDWAFPQVVIAGEPARFEWQYLVDDVAVTEGVFDCVFDPGDGSPAIDVADCGPSGTYAVEYDAPLDGDLAEIAPGIQVRQASKSYGPAGVTTGYLVAADGEPYHLRLDADITQGPAPLTVTFDALTVISGDPAVAEDLVCVLEFDGGTEDAALAWPCHADRGPVVERSGRAHTYAAAGTYEARLFVYQAPWLVDGGLASVQVEIEVH